MDLQTEKVAALRVLGLTPDERQRMLNNFPSYRGQDRMPTVPVVPARVQLGLQEQYPIDLNRIRALLNLVGRSDIAARLQLPATAQDQQASTNRDRELAEDVVNFETRDRPNVARVAPLLRDIYLYLRGFSPTETLPAFREGETPVDVVIVPGCRGQGMKLRTIQAVHVLGTSPTGAQHPGGQQSTRTRWRHAGPSGARRAPAGLRVAGGSAPRRAPTEGAEPLLPGVVQRRRVAGAPAGLRGLHRLAADTTFRRLG